MKEVNPLVWRILLAAGLLAAGFFVAPGCGAANRAGHLPQEKKDYAGLWVGETVRLSISDSGFVSYQRMDGAKTISLSGPITDFKGDDFIIHAFVLKTRFKVDKPPHMVEGQWYMVVEGYRLRRTGPADAVKGKRVAI